MHLVRAVGCGLLLAALGLPASAAAVPRDKTGASPQDAFESARKGDVKAFYRCLTPDSQKMLVGWVIAAFSITRAYAFSDSPVAKAIDEVFGKHGATKEALARAMPGPAKDEGLMLRAAGGLVKKPAAFLDDLVTAFRKLDEESLSLESLRTEMSLGKVPGKGRLTDVRITGAQATGRVVCAGRETVTIRFARVNGSWRLALFEPKFPPPARSPAAGAKPK